MSDQYQSSSMSFDEEMDVLLAIYKKNPQLLRPDQVKKLMDSGRVNGYGAVNFVIPTSTYRQNKNDDVIDQKVLGQAFDEVDVILLETDRLKHHYYSNEEWEQMDEGERFGAREKMFEDNFQIRIVDLAYSIYDQLVQGHSHA